MFIFNIIFVGEIYAKSYKLVYNDYNTVSNETCQQYEYIEVNDNLSFEEQITYAINYFFSSPNNQYIPSNVSVLSVVVNDDELILNVTEDIQNYGGTFYEKALVEQLLETTLSIEGINKVTLLIEGESKPLTEGTEINSATSW